MSKMIQIRNVPDDMHRQLKMRAAELGMSLSDYLKSELEYLVARPTNAEMAEILSRKRRVPLHGETARIIRRMREAG